MKSLIDVVNFNADASCLPSEKWLEVLRGGQKSLFYRWLKLYVDLKRKVVLGFPGATVADMVAHNPESIKLINKNPGIFEIILRPFAHDIALLRRGEGFSSNFSIGSQVIKKEFTHVTPYFLPPEFMLTNTQIFHLRECGVSGVFINPERFSKRIRSRIPSSPYMVRSLFGKSVRCIPFQGDLSFSYLEALHKYDVDQWNHSVLSSDTSEVFGWRDGESFLFVPDGINREANWLKRQDKSIQRQHLKNLKLKFLPGEKISDSFFKWYPVHSFSAWMKEFRMLGFISRIAQVEEILSELTPEQKHLWLMTINSDILSAIEKQEPVVQIRLSPSDSNFQDWVIHRSERGYEGEEYLAILESAAGKGHLADHVVPSKAAHMIKFFGRINYLSGLGPSSHK